VVALVVWAKLCVVANATNINSSKRVAIFFITV